MKLIQVNKAVADNTSQQLNVTGIDTDDTYFIVMENIKPTVTQAMYGRVLKGGTQDSSANMDYAYKNLKAYGAFSDTYFNNGSKVNFGTVGAEDNRGLNGVLALYNFNNPNEYSTIQQKTHQLISGTSLFGQVGGNTHTVSSASNGFSIYADFGATNLATGTLILYKEVI